MGILVKTNKNAGHDCIYLMVKIMDGIRSGTHLFYSLSEKYTG